MVYTVSHGPVDGTADEGPQQFNLVAVPVTGSPAIEIVENVGMFAYPVTSPVNQLFNLADSTSGESLSQNAFSIAYLQAIFPEQSETSGYRLLTIDRDGSNKRSLFPEEGAVGLEPQKVVWSPTIMESSGDFSIAVIYNGNIWIIDAVSGTAQQITGDGLTSRVDWR